MDIIARHRTVDALKRLPDLLAVFLVSACATVDDRPSVVIDGAFADWESTAPITIDEPDAPNGFIDFGAVKVRHDRDAVYLFVDVGRIVRRSDFPAP